MALSNIVVSTYNAVRNTGLLDVPAFKRGFFVAYFLYKRWLEDPYAAFAERYPELFSGGHIIDVGAHVGYTSTVFARVLNPGFTIFSFEPAPDNFADLCATIGRRVGGVSIVPIQAAVGARSGSIQLWLNQRNRSDHRIVTAYFSTTDEYRKCSQARKTVEAELCSLDSFVQSLSGTQQVAFIKIDVQGYELEVFKGMRETLTSNPLVTIAFEYAPASLTALGYDPHDIAVFFADLGMPLYLLTRDGRLSTFDQSRLAALVERRGYCELVATRNALGG
jgi:FkbM family methyltransferase